MKNLYTRPAALDVDYGHAIGDCREVGSTEVFTRAYSNANVTMDCKRFVGTIKMTAGILVGQTLGGD